MNTDNTALDTECDLTIAFRLTCECGAYFIRRRGVLLREVVKLAEKRDVDEVDLFAEYARKVHQRHIDGLSLATEDAA